MSVITKQLTFSGRVQGVGFRYSVRELAKGFMVVGSVENLPDGSVLMYVQGDQDEVEEFIVEISEESEVSHHIKDMLSEETEFDPELRGFKIIS